MSIKEKNKTSLNRQWLYYPGRTVPPEGTQRSAMTGPAHTLRSCPQQHSCCSSAPALTKIGFKTLSVNKETAHWGLMRRVFHMRFHEFRHGEGAEIRPQSFTPHFYPLANRWLYTRLFCLGTQQFCCYKIVWRTLISKGCYFINGEFDINCWT